MVLFTYTARHSVPTVNMAVLRIVLLTALLATAFADDAIFQNCDNYDAEVCEVAAVRITPCKKLSTKCVIKKGSDASIFFDFTPKFSASQLKTNVYWASGTGDIPFSAFGSDDGCTYSTCPTVPGQQQTFTYNLHINKKLPSGPFKLKWVVWDNADKARQCCFTSDIKLTK